MRLSAPSRARTVRTLDEMLALSDGTTHVVIGEASGGADFARGRERLVGRRLANERRVGGVRRPSAASGRRRRSRCGHGSMRSPAASSPSATPALHDRDVHFVARDEAEVERDEFAGWRGDADLEQQFARLASTLRPGPVKKSSTARFRACRTSSRFAGSRRAPSAIGEESAAGPALQMLPPMLARPWICDAADERGRIDRGPGGASRLPRPRRASTQGVAAPISSVPSAANAVRHQFRDVLDVEHLVAVLPALAQLHDDVGAARQHRGALAVPSTAYASSSVRGARYVIASIHCPLSAICR